MQIQYYACLGYNQSVGDITLKLYCGYKNTRYCLINRIWGLKKIWLHVKGHAWLHLHGLRLAVRNGEGVKNSKWKYMPPAGFEPTPSTPWQVNQRSRPLGHNDLTMICDLMSYRIVEYKWTKPLRDNKCQIDYGDMCIWTYCQIKSTFLYLNEDFS